MLKRFMPLVMVAAMLPLTSRAQVMVSTLTQSFTASGGVAVDEQGDIYVADFGTFLNQADGRNVYRVLRDGTVSVFATGLLGASGNTFDTQGNLFQSNIAGGRISKITPEGNVSTFATANIINPVGVALDTADNVYVANCRTPGQIVKITPAGNATILVTSNLMNCPNGLTYAADGNLYTCNFSDGNVIKISPIGEVNLFATIPGRNNGHLTFANGVLYVVSRGGNRIYEVTLDGQITLLAGTGACGKQDGPALSATFSFPNGIAASPDGDTLYVNDAVPLCNANLNPVVVRMLTGIRQTTGVQTGGVKPPVEFRLLPNHPNPFNPSTRIAFELPAASRVSLVVLDVNGRTVKQLVNAEQRSIGAHAVVFAAGGLASGTYYYRLEALSLNGSQPLFVSNRMMTYLK